MKMPGLEPIALTMTVPLWARAIQTKRSSPILTDWHAVTTAGSLDFDFERLRLPATTVIGACARTAIIDGFVRKCCEADPRLMLVNIGEGLDNRFGRVDNGALCCLDLDLPEVIRLRARFAPETKRRRLIGKSVLDYSWMEEVTPEFRTVLLVAEGVLMYLRLEDVRDLFARAADRFPGSQIVFDSLSPALARFGARIEMGRDCEARYRWGIRHAADFESWVPGYKLLE
ncbi:MAG TPA: class I SAM-dependent methyltransferase, partial [Bryobacteraceae bacterium]